MKLDEQSPEIKSWPLPPASVAFSILLVLAILASGVYVLGFYLR